MDSDVIVKVPIEEKEEEEFFVGSDSNIRKKRKIHKCPYENCKYVSLAHSSLEVHMRKHTGEKPFKCKECDYSTSGRLVLEEHMRSHTGVRLKCDQCDSSYRSQRGLNYHMETQHRQPRKSRNPVATIARVPRKLKVIVFSGESGDHETLGTH